MSTMADQADKAKRRRTEKEEARSQEDTAQQDESIIVTEAVHDHDTGAAGQEVQVASGHEEVRHPPFLSLSAQYSIFDFCFHLIR
jgi:hypothetical protein